MERELREAHLARERARQRRPEAAAAAEAAPAPIDEELGYIKTDDSFTKIFYDAGAGAVRPARDLFASALETKRP